MIGRKQPVEAQHRGEQSGDPDGAGPDASQDFCLGTDAEREQHDGEHKKAEGQSDLAALAHGQHQFAPEQLEIGRHRQNSMSRSTRVAAKSSSLSTAASASASGWCVAMTTRPPPERCMSLAAASRSSLAL